MLMRSQENRLQKVEFKAKRDPITRLSLPSGVRAGCETDGRGVQVGDPGSVLLLLLQES